MDISSKVGIKNRVLFFVFIIVVGALAGAFVWAFFFIMNLGIDFLWVTAASWFAFPFYPIVICGLGGLLIGLFEKRFGSYPPGMEEVMAEVKQTKRYRYDKLGISSIGAILPLLFGGSIGPEAGLTGAIAGICTWVGDRMKIAKEELEELTQIGLSATLGAIFSAPFFGFVAPLESDSESESTPAFPKRSKLFLNLVAIFAAFGAMLLLGALFGSSGGLYRYGAAEVGATELICALPLVIVAVLAGYIYHFFEYGTLRLGSLLQKYVVLRACITGLIIGAIGSILPFTLFAGEHQMGQLAATWQSIGALSLIATGILKLFSGALCRNCGWRGGNIFPSIFAGASLGFGMALLCGADPIFCVCISCGALCGSIMRKPLAVVMLLLLCFPVSTLIFIAFAALIAAALPLPAFMKAHKSPAAAKEA